MTNVVKGEFHLNLPHRLDTKKTGGGNGGGDMDERIKKLENDMQIIKTDLAIIKSNYATSSDLHKEIGAQTKWIAAILIAVAGISIGIAKLIF